ncbi:outer membrane protein [Legionella birminghamensis]|uniref:Outer membrane protein n=1 Tax=Legionella birminghamensis TaxID=28083 RepID=A0A378IA20_9GAMM|nr:outer membrane protein transport protein [Legionella birminghamensis]KTC75952.1 outer membrane protein [Legionella birminghamensis]STX32078.1 outer membrane protein [Legionella birminghamensis]
MRLNTIKAVVVGLGLLDAWQLAYASSYQKLIDLAYDNPSLINNTVKKAEAIIGNSILYGIYTYNGVVGPLSGSSTSKQWYNYPYGRLAYRFHPKWVGAVDVTHLEYINIVFPVNSMIRYASTAIVLQAVDVTPKLSYMVNENLAIGAAMNIDTAYKVQLDNVVDPYGELKNHSSDDHPALGWGLGAVYTAPTKTTLDLSYFSKIIHHTEGTSTWGMAQSKNYALSYPLPAIATFSIAQTIQEKWRVKGSVRYQWWDVFKNLVLENTALGKSNVVPQFFNNTWIYGLSVRYQSSDKLGLSLGAEHHQSPQTILYRSAGLASYKSVAVGAGFDYAFTETLKGQFIYGHAFSNAPINRLASVGFEKGKEKINGNVFDFTLTWHI